MCVTSPQCVYGAFHYCWVQEITGFTFHHLSVHHLPLVPFTITGEPILAAMGRPLTAVHCHQSMTGLSQRDRQPLTL